MKTERMYQIIRRPHVSEKTAMLQADSNQYVFEVRSDASKGDIKRAVEGLFEVDVEQVRVVNVKGKQKSFRLVPGRQKGWKKAYVRVRGGQTIEEVQAD
ncbi:50S ribosomal protein L23 [Wenzhouxiangella sp. XN201]|jgi:large subunit ribosomal protein L23|uniref:50S ribosomal protein L23 n=1 Tax=Wenzhouxiangella sp. XN201 TaxID=2710755 RepID=UPI0013C58494|nr:50S ribosomal protein L23 [Wenzhouxiangella sp. XN201]NEZ05246.1 50S ribosomal protein L23 [Wenzhouxiangella sp. XN201]